MEPLLISACLLGVACRYDGKSCGLNTMTCEALRKQYSLIPVCPEQLGGLTTPRVPAERVGQTVLRKDGIDVTDAYHRGAEETLRLCRLFHCCKALLKERSPSCGSGMIYDGSFRGTLCKGFGTTAELLIKNNIDVYGDENTKNLIDHKGE